MADTNTKLDKKIGISNMSSILSPPRVLHRPRKNVGLPLTNQAILVYRPFFLTAIAIALTAGATWGAALLWRIARNGSFTAASVFEINAHGHSQIYGWVGLFILGFGYQAFPRFWNTRLVQPGLALVAFALMAGGIVLRSLALARHDMFTGAHAMSLVGGLAETTAAALFLGQLIGTYRRGTSRSIGSDAFIFSSASWLLISIIGATIYSFALLSSPSREQTLELIATWQAALRDAQIHGVALMMILGVSMRLLPGIFGLRSVRPSLAVKACILLNLAVAGESTLLAVAQFSEVHALRAAVYLMWLALTAGILTIVLPLGAWKPFPKRDRSAKFVRAAYTWLGVSLIMLLAFPLYIKMSGMEFSHAYYGAIRHAITVGFISLMIMGVAAHVVPNLTGVNSRVLSSLWGPFILINVGCALRVSLQTLTDWNPTFFKFVGVSGTLEVIALAWWGVGLGWLIVNPGPARERSLQHDIQETSDSAATSCVNATAPCTCCRHDQGHQ